MCVSARAIGKYLSSLTCFPVSVLMTQAERGGKLCCKCYWHSESEYVCVMVREGGVEVSWCEQRVSREFVCMCV